MKDPHALGKPKLFAAGFTVLAALLMAGCGAGTSSSSTTGGPGSGSTGNGSAPGVSFKGQVDGGGPQNPIANSTVTLYAMGPAGSTSSCTGASCYGANAAKLTQATSNTSGAFTFGSYACPSGDPETYVIVTGGNPGGGTNSAIGLMALTGPCSSLSSSTFVMVNELTTAAAQWALAQFTGSAGQMIGTSSTNIIGLTNSVTLAMDDLVKNVGTGAKDSGIPASFLPWSSSSSTCTSTTITSNCDGLERLDTLANVLAACVNSSGPGSTPCTNLYDSTTGSTGAPSAGWTTLAAAHEVVTHPTTSVSAVYSLQTNSTVAPFQPDLSAAPLSWTLGLDFNPSGANFAYPIGMALDASGNLWVADNTSIGPVQELDSHGALVGSFDPSNTLIFPMDVAIDTSSNVWIANDLNSSGGNSITELDSSGALAGYFDNTTDSGANFTGPYGVAIDATGNVWVTNQNGNSVTELDSSGDLVSNYAPSGANFDHPAGVAVGSSGNVWVANQFGNTVTELDSSGVLVNNYAPSGSNFNNPIALALDNSANVWIANFYGSSVVELDSSGGLVGNYDPTGADLNGVYDIALDASGNVWTVNLVSSASVTELKPSGSLVGSYAPAGAGLSYPESLAIDSSGNVWAADCGSSLCGGTFTGPSTISMLVGLATPVLTPAQACLKENKNVCLP